MEELPISLFHSWRRHLERFPFKYGYKNNKAKVEKGIITTSIRDPL